MKRFLPAFPSTCVSAGEQQVLVCGSDAYFLPLSGLQHLVFCERQCALIHVEREWQDSDLTVEGTSMHSRVDRPTITRRKGVRSIRGMWLRSDRLGLVGRADLVELSKGADGTAIYRPIEYKHGERLTRLADDVQLCAQAMALEEWFGGNVADGAIMYGASRRRRVVTMTAALRAMTIGAAERYHSLWDAQNTPLARQEPKCRRCSLFDLCLPNATFHGERARRYVEGLFGG